MDVSLRKLTYLVTISKLGSLSRAAEQLNVSQPALSRSVADLERHFGAQIFERSRRGVALTSIGEQLVLEAERILRSAHNFDRKFQLAGKGQAGHLSIGMGPFVASTILPELARRIFRQHPRVELSSLIRPGHILIEALLESSIEIFVSPMDHRELPADIELEEVARYDIKIVARSGHPIFEEGGLTPAAVARYPIASPMEIPWVKALNQTSGMFACDNLHVLREAVLESDLIWFCPDKFVSDDVATGSLTMIDVGSPISLPIICARLKTRTLSPVGTEVVKVLKEMHSVANANPSSA